MGKRQRIWAARKTAELREQLGGKCKACGTTEDLTFDLIEPDCAHHSREWSWRISFYRQAADRGELQLLCGPCNAAKGDRRPIRTIAGIRMVLVRGVYIPAPPQLGIDGEPVDPF